MNIVDNKALLLKAIDNYELITHNERLVLKTLVQIAVDNIAVINIKKLSELTKVSRTLIYKAIDSFAQHGLVERGKSTRASLSTFKLKPVNLENITKHYLAQKNIK